MLLAAECHDARLAGEGYLPTSASCADTSPLPCWFPQTQPLLGTNEVAATSLYHFYLTSFSSKL